MSDSIELRKKKPRCPKRGRGSVVLLSAPAPGRRTRSPTVQRRGPSADALQREFEEAVTVDRGRLERLGLSCLPLCAPLEMLHESAAEQAGRAVHALKSWL